MELLKAEVKRSIRNMELLKSNTRISCMKLELYREILVDIAEIEKREFKNKLEKMKLGVDR